ncbi:unnamed protein product [Hermetia illucens]|uniref:G-protein coupled receptors family 1 profile domain-containing protein n=1 Tax=Hermetia illucens TaxID=343691 RepID=A0A7R8UML9_HERIL|nr:sex peptide receptor [Hermetia illucens]CAD7083289.1 unnamed protein product [Hermetia illucens]
MTETNKSVPQYCGDGMDRLHTAYVPMHGYASLLVCILGSIANGLNIAVLTRHEMRSPTNAILTGLAITDLLVMLDYIPYACLEYILPNMNYSREDRLTYGWAAYVRFHSMFAQICHTISIWLTVTLAVWRYIAVGYPQKNRIWCGMRTTLIAITASCIVCPLISIPLVLSFNIQADVELLDEDGNQLKGNASLSEGRNVTLYKVKHSELAMNNPLLLQANFWIYSVVIKIIPCIALTILSLRLIGALLEAKRRRKQLTTSNANGMKQMVNGKVVEKPRKHSKTLEKEKQTDRTTRMLLAVLLLFLITEFPQGILGLLSALLGNPFFMQCYMKLGEVMDILALLNSGINFILYCSMSRQFRSTFNLLFRPKFFDRWLPVAQDDENGPGRTDAGRENNGLTTQVTQV